MKNKLHAAVLALLLILVGQVAQAQQYSVLTGPVQLGNGTSTAGVTSTGKLQVESSKAFNNPVVREFFTPATLVSQPFAICADSSGNLYVTEFIGNNILALTPAGVATEYPLPTANSQPNSICVGPDGNIYGTESSGNNVFQLNPATGLVTEFAVPSASAIPNSICVGADGNLYGAENAVTQKVFQMTTAGVFTEFAATGAGFAAAMCPATDGNLYFFSNTANKMYQLTTSGVVTQLSATFAASANVNSICQGADGNLYGAEQNSSICRIFKLPLGLTGTATQYTPPTFAGQANSVCAGSDGNIYGTEFLGNNVFQMTPGGVFTEYSLSNLATRPVAVCQGIDGNLYGTEQQGNCLFVKGITLAWNNLTLNGAPVSATNPLPVSGAANQSVNLAQVAGATTATGHGTASGALRVELPTDGTGIVGAGAAATSNTTMQSAAVANGNGTVLSTAGYATVALNLTGSMSGGTTVNFEVSPDGGTTWLSCLGTQVGTTTTATSTTALGSWQFNVTGYSQMRARISAYSAGTLTVIGYVSPLAYRGPPVAPVTLASLGMDTFVSADQVVSAGAAFSIAHGLGRTPKETWYALVNQIANAGYSPGDVITGYPGTVGGATTTVGPGVTMWATSSNVQAVLSSGTIDVGVKTTGASASITAADWKIRFYAR